MVSGRYFHQTKVYRLRPGFEDLVESFNEFHAKALSQTLNIFERQKKQEIRHGILQQ